MKEIGQLRAQINEALKDQLNPLYQAKLDAIFEAAVPAPKPVKVKRKAKRRK